jgi:glycosyltransferase involved in cell wall biosynthesis
MHVLLVNNLYPPFVAGGAELVVAYLAEELARRGHRVTAVSTCAPDMEPCPAEMRNGVEVIRFFPRNVYWSFTRAGQPPLKRALWHLRDAWNHDAGRRFFAILQGAQPDIVHTHVIDGFSAAIWRRARHRGTPVLHTAHDYHLMCPRAFLLTRDWKLCVRPGALCRAYRAWHLRTAANIDLFASPSCFLLDRHIEAGLRPRRSVVVRNGIPLPPPRTPRRRMANEPMRLLLLCRLTVEKGVRVVLQAMQLVPQDLPFELVIAGKGPLEAEVVAAADHDPRIRFAGFVQGAVKEALLTDADHLLIPSLWYENAPVAVIEAAAYGLGVIGSRIGGIPEAVEEGRTGVLFEPGDAAGLAAAIQDLAGGRVELQDFNARARAVAERHTVAGMTDAYLAHYDKMIQQGAQAASNRVPAGGFVPHGGSVR